MIEKIKNIDHYKSKDYINQKCPTVIFYEQQKIKSIWHDHDFYELVFVLSGTGYHKDLNQKHTYKKGSIFFIRPQMAHCYQADADFNLINCLFSKQYFDSLKLSEDDFYIDQDITSLFIDPESPLYQRIMKNLKIIDREQENQAAYSVHLIRNLMAEVLVYIQREAECMQQANKSASSINVVREYISKHYLEDISINQLAEISGFNPSYLSRYFKKATGYSLIELINECKIKKACDLLTHTDTLLVDIWKQVGYNSGVYFHRSFKKVTGLSPAKYKKSYQNLISPQRVL